ncbi:hypothetical protein ID866_10547 [Astraeus odoratus]|nr:hypothetical protein ID866_10547 [Astraeus odoratus]
MENVKTTFLCIMAVALVYTSIKIWRNRVLRRGLPLPPGPKALPFIGNLLIMDTGRPWVTYAEWGRQYGGIIYSTLLEKDFIIINDNDIAYELLERRSAVYSDRPYLSTNEFFGLDFNTAFLPYGNKWRLHRKMTNFAFSKQASAAYKPMQIGRAYQLLENMISTPYDYVNHIYTFSGSVIMAITYGYDAAAENDPFVTKAKMLMVHAGNVLSGERAALLTAFPMLAYIPSWLPGGRYKQQAGECRALARQVLDDPVSYVQQNMATGSARKSLVYDILHKGIGQCADSNHVETTKEVAATAFGAGVETVSCMSVH